MGCRLQSKPDSPRRNDLSLVRLPCLEAYPRSSTNQTKIWVKTVRKAVRLLRNPELSNHLCARTRGYIVLAMQSINRHGFADREDESYAIYSVLLTSSQREVCDQSKLWLIGNTTVTPDPPRLLPKRKQGCLRFSGPSTQRTTGHRLWSSSPHPISSPMRRKRSKITGKTVKSPSASNANFVFPEGT